MRLRSSTQFFLALGLLFTSSFVALNSASSQSKVLDQNKIYSCDEVKDLYRDLRYLSRDELREVLNKKICHDCSRNNPAEPYTYAKYYVCRFPEDDTDVGRILKRYVAKYEKGIKEQQSK